MDLLTAMDQASPIGFIPRNYPHFDELLKQAHIGCRRETHTVKKKIREKIRDPATGKVTVQTRTEPETKAWTEWFIVYDEKMYPAKHRTPSGKLKLDYTKMQYGTAENAKFCAILDYVQYRGERTIYHNHLTGSLDRANVLDVCIGKTPYLLLPDGSKLDIGKKIMELKRLNVKEVYDELATAGVKGYNVQAKITTEPEQGVEQVAAELSGLPF
jgi:hypothetical protein